VSFSGLTGITTIEERRIPNQGIWRSGYYALIGAGIGIPIWFCLWFLSNQYMTSIGVGLRMLPAITILIALRSGLIPCIQHLLVRFCLWQGGIFGFRGVHFLEYVAGHSLLYRTGGGYIFGHRLLQEYFL
jgi:hypothetical protein